MLNTRTTEAFFGALRCYSCGNLIKEVALTESGDEDHIYCRHCWGVKVKEAEHRRKCIEAKTKAEREKLKCWPP